MKNVKPPLADYTKMNSDQRAGVTHSGGPCLVLAGPGSGKTFVITNRIRYLIEHLGVPPERILVITFTKAAAAEMQSRFQALTNHSFLPVQFGTFHAVFYSILQKSDNSLIENFISEKEKFACMQSILTRLIPAESQSMIPSYVPKILSFISYQKNTGKSFSIPPSLLPEEIAKRAILEYHRFLRERRKVEYDDMARLCLELFQTNPDIKRVWQNRYDHVLVDEFQDINSCQYQVLRQLINPESDHLLAVGDDDQTIYSFRGADPNLMKQMLQDYPGTKVIKLLKNYRSCPEIVTLSQKLISHNKKRFEKFMHAAQEYDKGISTGIRTAGFLNEEKMNLYILHRIQETIENAETTDATYAIIYRTHKMAVGMTELLRRHGIKVRLRDKIQSLFEHFVVQDMLAYLSLAHAGYTRKEFLTIMNKPVRYLQRCALQEETFTFSRLREYYREKAYVVKNINKMEKLIQKVSILPLDTGLQLIRKWGGYDEYLVKYCLEHRIDREETFMILDKFELLCRQVQDFRELLKLLTTQNEVQMNMDTIEIQETEGCVNILTYHGAKGLEFEEVFLPNLNEGKVPYSRTEDMEEERRAFYVAMTRAKKRLHLLYLQNEAVHKCPSRFLYEMKQV